MMIVAIAHTTSRHTTSTTTTTGTAIATLFMLLVIMVTVDVVEGCDVVIVAVLGVRIDMVTMPVLNFVVRTTVKEMCCQ